MYERYRHHKVTAVEVEQWAQESIRQVKGYNPSGVSVQGTLL